MCIDNDIVVIGMLFVLYLHYIELSTSCARNVDNYKIVYSPKSSMCSDIVSETITKRTLTVNIVIETIITTRAINFCFLVGSLLAKRLTTSLQLVVVPLSIL